MTRLSTRVLTAAERVPHWLGALGTFALAVVLGVGDYLTGAFVAFTALYLVPISLGAWFGRRELGLGLAVFCTAEWLVTDVLTRAEPLTAPLFLWNLTAQLMVFGLTAALVHTLRRALVEERDALLTEHRRALEVQHQLEHAQRLATVGKLAAGVAHELGTPLNVVGSYAQLIEEGAVDGSEAAHVIREQTDAMTRIVRQLVDFARAARPHRALHSLQALIDASLSMLTPMAKKRHVTLVRGDGAPLSAEVDAGQLQQVLSNLVVNAIQAMASGGVVTVSAGEVDAAPPPGTAPPRRCAVLCVEDDGPGIAPEVLEHLFEPFVTTNPIGEGSGLGLAVAWGLVQQHHGWMTAENLTRGARFSVFLPL